MIDWYYWLNIIRKRDGSIICLFFLTSGGEKCKMTKNNAYVLLDWPDIAAELKQIVNSSMRRFEVNWKVHINKLRLSLYSPVCLICYLINYLCVYIPCRYNLKENLTLVLIEKLVSDILSTLEVCKFQREKKWSASRRKTRVVSLPTSE